MGGQPRRFVRSVQIGQGVTFIQAQRNADGLFGFWTDEEAVVQLGGGSVEDFSGDLVRPISELCQALLDSVAAQSALAG